MTRVRDGGGADLEATLAIYNELIPSTTIAWTERPTPMAEREAWFAQQRARGFPVLVADDAGTVVGVASYGDFRDTAHWEGYRYSVELSIHVRADRRGAGIGRLLMEALVERARAAGVHVMVAAVDGDNEGSIRFHERLGFTVVGRMPETGFKFGRWLDLVLLQRILTSA
jgi:phosphinothricin acetyltransferase